MPITATQIEKNSGEVCEKDTQSAEWKENCGARVQIHGIGGAGQSLGLASYLHPQRWGILLQKDGRLRKFQGWGGKIRECERSHLKKRCCSEKAGSFRLENANGAKGGACSKTKGKGGC